MSALADDRRYCAIDYLRAWMMLLLIPFHAAIPFITVRAPHGFNDLSRHALFDAFVLFLVSFRRPVFFLVGGVFAAMLLDRRGLAGMVQNRFQRIFLLLVLGWIVLSPMTRAAYEFAATTSKTGSIEEGIEAVNRGGWLDWSNPYHLWFLIALLLFYRCALALKWALRPLSESTSSSLARLARRLLASPWRPLVFAAMVAFALVPSEFYPHNRGNVFLAIALALFFGLGWLIYEHVDLLERQTRHAWKYVAIGVLVMPVAAWAKRVSLHSSESVFGWNLASGIACPVMAAFMTFGVLGVFLAHADRKSATTRYLSDSSYWIYLSHLPLVIFVGGLLSPAALPAIVKLLITCTIVTPSVLLSYHYFVRFTALGALLNGPRERAEPRASKGELTQAAR